MRTVIFREAVRADLPAILALLADDVLGRARDVGEVDDAYERAFADISADPRNHLVVADDGGVVVGCLQITYIPGLGRHGAQRSLIEAVRVRSDRRGQGLGGEMIRWAIDQARQRGCALVQLTTDKSRTDAHRFYVALGFQPTHRGHETPPLTSPSPSPLSPLPRDLALRAPANGAKAPPEGPQVQDRGSRVRGRGPDGRRGG